MVRQTSLGFASEPPAALTTGLANDPMNSFGSAPTPDPNAWDTTSPAASSMSSDGIDPRDPYGVGNPRKPFIDAKKNPLKAIGALLLNTSAGMQGKPLYTDRLMQQYQEEQQLSLDKMKLVTTALPQAIDMIKKAPAESRADLANAYSQTIGNALGGDFSNILMRAAEAPDNSKALVDLLGQNGQDLLNITGGDYEAAMKLAQDDKFVARIQGVRDQKLGSQLMDTLAGIDDELDGNPEYDTIQETMKDGWTTAEARDPLFQRATGITDAMLDALDRSPDLQEQLRGSGFIPASDQKLKAEQDIKNAGKRESVWDKSAGQLRFATADEIAKDPENLLPAAAKPDAPDKPDFEGGLMAVNPKNGEVLDSPVTYDGNANKYSLADGSPLPPGYIVTRANLNATKAGDLGGLSKGAQAKTENDVITLSDSLANAKIVQKNFKPEYLEIAPNLLVGGLAALERAGMKLNAKQKDQVERFGQYKQDGIQIINEGIKGITGAAMTESETPRLRKQFADIESDSPTQFKAKIDNYVKKVELAMARKQWFIENGVTVDFTDKEKEPPVSMEGYERMVNDRGPALTEKALSGGLDALSGEERAALKIYREGQRSGGK